MRLAVFAILLSAIALGACVAKPAREPVAADIEKVDIGLKDNGLRANIVATGLKNPSWATFRPGSDALTICDSGNGRVVEVGENGLTTLIDGMATEYWKVLDDGRELFKVGPLTAVWLSESEIAVGDGGAPDGEEAVLTYRLSSGGAEIVARTNTVGPTTDDDIDMGEGNLSGMVMMENDKTFFIGGQGADSKTWVLRGDIEEGTLEPWLSADDNGIEINSPMQCLNWRGNLLVLYSGAGGVEEGLAVEWDVETRKPVNRWHLGLIDPMGMAPVPGTNNEFIVTDNVWDLEKVNPGKLYRVRLLKDGKIEKVLLADNVPGPVHCAFGPDGRLYVTCLGWEYDKDQGKVIAIDGLTK